MINVNAETMRSIDKYCIEVLGISGMILMENAAIKIFTEVKNELVKNNGQYISIFCGVGNNGGDGLAVARHLYLSGYTVNIFILGKLEKASNDFKENFKIINNINKFDDMKINIEKVTDENINFINDKIRNSDIILDGIFGTGLKRKVEGVYKEVILTINKSGKHIISIDVPSGLDSDNGIELGAAVRANKTITLQLKKNGFLNEQSRQYCGKIKIVDIGIPDFVINKFL